MWNDKALTVTCKQCSNRVLIKETILDKKVGALVCNFCVEKTMREAEKARKLAEQQPPKVYYTCTNCNYKFTRSINFVFSGVCFYCGKYGVTRDDDTTKTKIGPSHRSILDY